MSTPGSVTVAGSINADIVVRAERLPLPGETVAGSSVEWFPGGKGANQAAAAATAGAATRFIGCVGTDEHAPRLVDALEGFGVTVNIREVAGVSGQAYITVDEHGENSIVVVPGANAALDTDAVTGLGLGGQDVAVAPLEVPVATVLAFLADAAPARRILNPTPVERFTAALLAETDIVVVNEHEHATIGDEALAHAGCEVVITLGPLGAVVAGETLPGIAVEAVDTTGAGDCFVGTLAARLALGDDLRDAAEHANAAAARSVTKPGAMASYR